MRTMNEFICSAIEYFDYEFVNTSQSSTTWQRINLRCRLEFRYYSRDDHCSVVCACQEQKGSSTEEVNSYFISNKKKKCTNNRAQT
jgi:hypothetical protein